MVKKKGLGVTYIRTVIENTKRIVKVFFFHAATPVTFIPRQHGSYLTWNTSYRKLRFCVDFRCLAKPDSGVTIVAVLLPVLFAIVSIYYSPILPFDALQPQTGY
jgi:hypothetical protein